MLCGEELRLEVKALLTKRIGLVTELLDAESVSQSVGEWVSE
jgi:hypothetical protein